MKRSVCGLFLRNSYTGLLLLAIIFSTGLIFAFIELPALLDKDEDFEVGFYACQGVKKLEIPNFSH